MDARIIDWLYAEHQTLEEVLQARIDGLSEWIVENAPECRDEQRHLDEGTPERTYWHFGYLTALRDVQSAIRKQRRAFN